MGWVVDEVVVGWEWGRRGAERARLAALGVGPGVEDHGEGVVGVGGQAGGPGGEGGTVVDVGEHHGTARRHGEGGGVDFGVGGGGAQGGGGGGAVGDRAA